MVRLCGIVSLVSGEPAREIFRTMPLPAVYDFENLFYRREGYEVIPYGADMQHEAGTFEAALARV